MNTESDVAQMAKLLAKQVAVVSVNTLMLQEQAAVESADFGRKAKNEVIWCASYY